MALHPFAGRRGPVASADGAVNPWVDAVDQPWVNPTADVAALRGRQSQGHDDD